MALLQASRSCSAGVPKQNFGLAAPDVAPPPASASAPHYPSPGRSPTPLQQQQCAYPPPPPPPQQHQGGPAFGGGGGYSGAQQGGVHGRSGAAYGPPQPAGSGRGAGGGSFKQAVSLKDKEAAKKLAKQVVSALNFDDTKSAVDALRAALELLTE